MYLCPDILKMRVMKRALLCAAALSMLFLTGCKKVDPTRPSVTWESNSSFSTKELTADLDAKVTVRAPGKIRELNLALSLGQYNILANQYIKIGSHKGTASSSPVLDLVNDDFSVSFVRSLGMTAGTALKEKEEVTLDLKAILEAIVRGQVVENNTNLSIDIQVKDQSDQYYSRKATFHFTSAPVISWAKNSDFSPVDVDAAQKDCKVEVWAPGKIEKLTVKLEDGAASRLEEHVKNRTTDRKLLIDLIADEKVADSFKNWFPAGKSVSGKDQVILDFGFLYDLNYDLAASTNVFTIDVVDKNGKETVQQVKFVKK